MARTIILSPQHIFSEPPPHYGLVPWLVLLVTAIIFAAGGICRYKFLQQFVRRQSRLVPGQEVFIGGMRWPSIADVLGSGASYPLLSRFGGTATFPFARLSLYSKGIRVGSNGWSWATIPSYDIPWSEIVRIDIVSVSRLRLTVRTLRGPIIFLSNDLDRVVLALQRYGIQVGF